MATYAIGDVQGCFAALQRLLNKIQFNPLGDFVWFTGDLINRGKQSLEVLRFVKQLGPIATTVLGNHDLHYLAVANGLESLKKSDTFIDILQAPDVKELTDWLRQRPLIYYDKTLNFLLVHAGLAPQWDLTQAMACAAEVETVLRSDNYKTFLADMYGDIPTYWDKQLKGHERLRTIINFCTRMRYLDTQGRLDLSYKGPIGGQPINCYPWFALPHRQNQAIRIIFGHWASLNGKANTHNIYALDTGCCWGNCLTAMRLEDQQYYCVDCSE